MENLRTSFCQVAAALVVLCTTVAADERRPVSGSGPSNQAARVTGPDEHLQSLVAGYGFATMEFRLTPVASGAW